LKYIFISFSIITLFVSACSVSKPEPSATKSNFYPKSHEVTLVESFSTDEILVRATGKGSDFDSATNDSKLASLWFAIEGGENRIISTPEERKKFAKFSNEFYKNSDKYITKSSKVQGKRTEGKTTFVTKNYRLNVRLLREDLIAKGVAKELDEIAEAIDYPVISILPAEKDGSDFQFSSDVAFNFLSERNFEAEVVSKISSSGETVKKYMMMSGDVDPSYLLALSTGSDVYISLKPKISERVKNGKHFKKASISLKAFYTATNRLIASETGHSREIETSSSDVLLEEATNDAIDKLLSKIERKWKKAIEDGRYFQIVLKSNFKNASSGLNSLLRENCKKVNRKAGKTVFSFVAQCPMKNSLEVFEMISENYEGEGVVFREFDSNSVLILKIGYTEDDDIIIE
jgi:hypothetical protein